MNDELKKWTDGKGANNFQKKLLRYQLAAISVVGLALWGLSFLVG